MNARFRQPGFTLIELMVVIGIIVLLAAVAIPAVGPMLASNHQSQAINTLTGLMTSAQTAAQANGTDVGLRIERAYKMNKFGLMVDASGRNQVPGSLSISPVWLNYQQIRFVTYGIGRTTSSTRPVTGCFQWMAGTTITPLPTGAWLAPDTPDYSRAASPEPNTQLDPTAMTLYGDLNSNVTAAPFKPFETFYVVFNPQGTVTRFVANGTSTFCYRDDTQNNGRASPYVPYPYDSARSVLVYDRAKFEGLGSTGIFPTQPTVLARQRDFLARESRPIFVNRFLGNSVEGEVR